MQPAVAAKYVAETSYIENKKSARNNLLPKPVLLEEDIQFIVRNTSIDRQRVEVRLMVFRYNNAYSKLSRLSFKVS